MNAIADTKVEFFKIVAGWSDLLQPQAQSVGDFLFFRIILDYLRKQIRDFGIDLMTNAMQWVGGITLVLLTLWILIQGWRVVTGQSRDSMMALVSNSLKATLIVSVATSMAFVGSDMHEFLTEDLKKEINLVVTGENGSPEDQIDANLGWMQVALSSIDGLHIVGDPTLDSAKTRAMWFVGFGTGGPAITGGTMLLLYEVALALFIGLGPIFILCLLFDQTKSLFQRWLFYGIGTMFSMAVLSAMVSISLKMVTAVAQSFWGAALLGQLMHENFTDGMTSQAMQQGGMGLILTTLILTAPPMAAAFFQGTLGQFTPYGAFGQSATATTSYPPGQGPVSNTHYVPSTPGAEGQVHSAPSGLGRIAGAEASAIPSPGKRGLAHRGDT